MTYINTQTLAQVSEQEIRALHPNTSFPALFVPPSGYVWVFPVPTPTHNEVTQTVQAITPVQTVPGRYEQRWEVVELYATQGERDAAIAANVEAKRIAAVPASISPRQLRQALSRAGLRTSVEAAVAAADQDTKDWYEWATVFERQHPRVVAMGVALGQTTRQLDDLFTLGGSL
jgi:hypothetical protein